MLLIPCYYFCMTHYCFFVLRLLPPLLPSSLDISLNKSHMPTRKQSTVKTIVKTHSTCFQTMQIIVLSVKQTILNIINLFYKKKKYVAIILFVYFGTHLLQNIKSKALKTAKILENMYLLIIHVISFNSNLFIFQLNRFIQFF